MFSVTVRGFISSAHFLREYKGKCENMHGHNWQVDVTVEKQGLGPDGMVMDFTVLKGYVKEIVDELDHKVLNELEPFEDLNPSAENIARYVFKQVQERILGSNCRVAKVDIWEQRDSCATYFEVPEVEEKKRSLE